MMRPRSAPNGATTEAAPLTADQLRALRTLEAARPLGVARIKGGFRGIAGSVSALIGQSLVALGLARIDYAGRYPRLKITRLGRARIGAYREQ